MRSNPAWLKHTAILVMSLLLAGVVANTFASAGAGPALKAGVFNPPRLAPEFSLRGSDGSEVTLARYRGKVVVMAFGYTSCAAVCPTAKSSPAPWAVRRVPPWSGRGSSGRSTRGARRGVRRPSLRPPDRRLRQPANYLPEEVCLDVPPSTNPRRDDSGPSDDRSRCCSYRPGRPLSLLAIALS